MVTKQKRVVSVNFCFFSFQENDKKDYVAWMIYIYIQFNIFFPHLPFMLSNMTFHSLLAQEDGTCLLFFCHFSTVGAY